MERRQVAAWVVCDHNDLLFGQVGLPAVTFYAHLLPWFKLLQPKTPRLKQPRGKAAGLLVRDFFLAMKFVLPARRTQHGQLQLRLQAMVVRQHSES